MSRRIVHLICILACVALAAHEAHGQTAREIELSLQEGTWMSLDISPDGRWIAFDLLNDIYLLPAAGGEARAIHRGSAVQRNPRFSPDGSSIVYVSDASGADNLWISAIDGSQARQITREDYAIIGAPDWTPDGRSLVAVKRLPEFRNMRAAQIHRISIDGRNNTIVVPPPASGRDVQEPVMSPDGRHLLYTERVAGDHYVYVNTGMKNFEIKRLDLVSGVAEAFITGFGGATTPQISGDGKSVAFIRRVGAKTALFVMDITSREQRLVHDNLTRDLQGDYIAHEHYYPAYAWFPDNRHVAIWSRGGLMKIDTQTTDVSDIPFTLTSRHTLQPVVRFQHDPAPERFDARIMRQLALHPDGKTLAFRAAGRLYSQNLSDAKSAQRITKRNTVEHDPAWSPEGDQLAYVAWHDGVGSRLLLRSFAGGAERTLVTDKGMIREPRFSSSGRFLAFRIMPTDPSVNLATSPPGLYLLDLRAADPEPKRLTAATQVLRFAPDENRIFFMGKPDYASGKVVRLLSIRLDGSNEREHAFAATRDVDEVALSADLKWLAFKQENLPYLAPFRFTRQSTEINAKDLARARQLTETGGYGLTFNADGTRLLWTLGRQLYTTSPRDEGLASAPSHTLNVALTADVPEGVIALTGARLITMNGPVIEDGTLLISGNRIQAIGASSRVAIPDTAHRVDVSGKTVLPGFFDAHGHIDCCWQSGVTPNQQPTRHAALAYGITTNFDPYSNDLTSYESAEMTRTGNLIGPRWLSSGQVVYGRAGRADSTFHPIYRREDAINLLKRRQQLGHSILKSYKLTTREQRQWLVDAARDAGFMVDGEGAGAFYDIISMVIDGHTNIEHNVPVPTYHEDLLQLFAAAKVGTTPTLIVAFGELFGENYIYQTQRPWDDDKVRRFNPAVNASYNPIASDGAPPLISRSMHSIHVADEIYDIGFRAVSRSVKALDDRGVRINAGSHGQVAGLAFHWELQLLAEGGMSPMRILRAATVNPAWTFGMDHEIGTLEPGKLADVVVLDANPLEDIRNTNTVRYTMVNGRLYDAHTLDEVGNRPRPRDKFYWEREGGELHDWNRTWSSQ